MSSMNLAYRCGVMEVAAKTVSSTSVRLKSAMTGEMGDPIGAPKIWWYREPSKRKSEVLRQTSKIVMKSACGIVVCGSMKDHLEETA